MVLITGLLASVTAMLASIGAARRAWGLLLTQRRRADPASAAGEARGAPSRAGPALAVLLESLLPLARAVGYNPIRLLVAVGLLTADAIANYLTEEARRTLPPPA
jgi:hypothetical protein